MGREKRETKEFVGKLNDEEYFYNLIIKFRPKIISLSITFFKQILKKISLLKYIKHCQPICISIGNVLVLESQRNFSDKIFSVRNVPLEKNYFPVL